MPNTVQFNPKDPDISESDRLYARASGLIPAYSQTLAKGPTQYVRGVAPKYLRRGQGAHVWDVDGNEYIDYNMGIGPLSLGYAYERVDRAIREQLADGITYSLVHPLEVELAELVREIVPNAEMVRYSKTGAEVTSAAVRAARAYTGRDKVLCCGYHGWHDWYIGLTGRNIGVPQAIKDLVQAFPYNDIEALRQLLDEDTACVIMEPMIFELPRDDFLSQVRQACHENGSLFILDEMWTGFRLAVGGAQEYFGIEADLACFSKAIANGMPISVLTGRTEIMELFDQQIFFFSTFGGEALSLAAAVATIHELVEKDVPAHLARQGQKLLDGYKQIVRELGLEGHTDCQGHPCRTIVTFTDKAGDPLLLKSLLQQELIRRGILWSGFHNMCFSHSDEDVDYTLRAYRDALPMLKAAIEADDVAGQLRGEPVQPVFRQTK
ncbi:MAG: aminotransferase class III-fold pyridoxal phosphate-dependent enzyme [Chloroflexia bacterium]|nr:aminotransferase class III-fold pyridoxal phosphate-dependent enzyme [Chloroflexia bacterium]